MSPPAPRAPEPAAPSFDVRWARWREDAAVQDRLWTRRAAVVATVTFCVLAIWLTIGVYRAWNARDAGPPPRAVPAAAARTWAADALPPTDLPSAA